MQSHESTDARALKICKRLTNILELPYLQKMSRTSRHSRSIVEDKIDKHSGASISSEKYLGPPGTPGVLKKSYKNMYKLGKHSGASISSEKYPDPPGTHGVLYKSYKNIYQFDKHSGAFM